MTRLATSALLFVVIAVTFSACASRSFDPQTIPVPDCNPTAFSENATVGPDTEWVAYTFAALYFGKNTFRESTTLTLSRSINPDTVHLYIGGSSYNLNRPIAVYLPVCSALEDPHLVTKSGNRKEGKWRWNDRWVVEHFPIRDLAPDEVRSRSGFVVISN